MEKIEREMKLVSVIKSSKIICDKCGKEIMLDAYDAFECKFEYKIGDVYPEGGSVESLNLDLCKNCGKEAIEILKSKGFNFYKEDHDY